MRAIRKARLEPEVDTAAAARDYIWYRLNAEICDIDGQLDDDNL